MNRKAAIYFASLLIIGTILLWQGWQSIPKQTLAPTTATAAPIEAPVSAKSSSNGLVTAQVTRVIDGDTIEVNLNGQLQKVRYLGMNTPETVDPRRGVQCFGHEASDENKSLVAGKTVILTKDVSETDKYGRLLRFVYLPQSNGQDLFVNDYLVREGFAQIDTIPPDVKFADQFIAAQHEAESQNRGLWAKCK